MKIVLLNPPHISIGSRIPEEKLPPLGLLYIGGALIDIGYKDVEILNADYHNLSVEQIVDELKIVSPDIILMGHSGSTSAHPTIIKIAEQIKAFVPKTIIIYGGVYPSYHAYDILRDNSCIDFIVKGEGEAIIQELLPAIEREELSSVKGIVYRESLEIISTTAAPTIKNLDDYRIGWELINIADYSYWGHKRAVIVQFSRGCPHKCSYCGQREFWETWRHRDPVKFAKELARLHREEGVEVFNFADENPTTKKEVWQLFLETLIAENIEVTLVGSTRADDIVRDEDILHLYKKAGFERFLLGIENYDESTLKRIKKGTTTQIDQKAIALLRKNGILSMATYVFGFEEETLKDYWGGLQKIIAYDPDQIQMLYATPHRWTSYYHEVKHRELIQPDLRKWDYKHQIMKIKRVSPLMLFVSVKVMELILQLRPKALKRYFFQPDKKIRHATRWYYKMGRKVWFHEVYNFFFGDNRLKRGESLEAFGQKFKRVKGVID
jgi:anaerobic magnesium-protoporphyrin IX monomethyl ester cyclase